MRHCARPIVPLALAVLALGVLGKPASADGLRWQHRESASGAVLAWEKLDTDDQPLVFSCDASDRSLRVGYVHPSGQRSRDIPLELSSEGGRVQLRMQGERSELDDSFVLSTRTSLTPELMNVLSRGRHLTVRVRGDVARIPLAGAAPGVAELARKCGATPTG